MRWWAVLVAALLLSAGVQADGPNILWIVAEDTSPWMGYYGDPINAGATPQIDALAESGVLFRRAFVPAPVCSPCRSALMAGQRQIRRGAHEHRSSRGPVKIALPEGMKLLPQIMKEHGYYTFNLGKTDYNYVWDEAATHSLLRNNRGAIPWETLKRNQPFFGQIQTSGGKTNTTRFTVDDSLMVCSLKVCGTFSDEIGRARIHPYISVFPCFERDFDSSCRSPVEGNRKEIGDRYGTDRP